MKYPQLVSERAVSTISDWLVTRLEVLGVEAPIVYSRLLLSLLHTPLQVDSVDLADIPQLKNWLGKRFNSRRLTQSEAEKLKRVAAIESLMDVVEANEKRSHIVELVSELCGKLRDLERVEDQPEELEQVWEAPSSKTAMKSSVGGGSSSASGTKNKDSSGTNKAARPSNPYYQMFPALSGSIPVSNSSSRATSISGGVMSESSTSSNWGRNDCQQQMKGRQSERLMAHEMHLEGVAGVDNGGGGNGKRKNKKRRTHGPSAVASADNNSRKGSVAPASAQAQPHPAQSVAVAGGGGRKKQNSSKYVVEWDTNFSGLWEMEDQDPIKEFLKAQRTTKATTTAAAASDNDCESVANGSVSTMDVAAENELPNAYDHVFKMKRSDVNEEQTMLIKSFLIKNQSSMNSTQNSNYNNCYSTAKNSYNRPEMPSDQPPAATNHTLGFGFDAAEEYFNLSLNEDEQRDTHRRLFEREVSAESLTGSGVGGAAASTYRAGAAHDMLFEEPTTEFDAKLDAFKAKFDMNIRNLWGQEAASASADAEERGEESSQQHQQPMSVNSFWQNYNKHLYEFQDNNNNNGLAAEVGVGGGGWPEMRMEEQQNLFYDQLAKNTAIWSNNDFNEPAVVERAPSVNHLHAYSEHMAAAYMNRLEFGGAAPPGSSDQSELFGAISGGVGASDSTHSNTINSDAELEQLYFSIGASQAADLHQFGGQQDSAPMDLIDAANYSHQSELASNKLEQSIAMINHSSTSSFAKVDKKVIGKNAPLMFSVSGAAAGGGRGATDLSGSGRGGSLSASSSSTAITNMSSLYGSFKQNSMENLLTSERTHFRPIKQAYLDGHTFDIPCSPDTIEYVRSQSGSLFFELDKYMEYTVEPQPTRKSGRADDEIVITNVPISRCGTIVTESEAAAEEVDAEEPREEPATSSSIKKFTLKFCVRQQNEKCCQTETIDYEALMMASARTTASSDVQEMKKYPKYVLPNVCTLANRQSGGVDVAGGQADGAGAEVVSALEEKWSRSEAVPITAHNLSLLWENSDSNSLDSSLNYDSLPANRLLRDELSADAEEILKDSLTYMQNLYLDDMEEVEEQERNGGELGEEDELIGDDLKNEMDLANYYEMGQLISEILNPGTAQKLAPAGAGTEEDILWYKNWSQKNWLPTILDQSAAVVSSLCKDAKNVWQYSGGGGGGANNCNLTMHSSNSNAVEENNNNNTMHTNNNYMNSPHHTSKEERATTMDSWNSENVTAEAEWKFSNLRMLWDEAELILNENSNSTEHPLSAVVIPEVDEEEVDDDLLLGEEKNYHLIIFEKTEKPASTTTNSCASSRVVVKGRKRRHSASQNLYDEDLEFFNGDEVKWYDYCCKCDCGKRSEKILKYRNKLLMKRVDKMGYVHNASLLLKNLSKQFDSIDEILNEGLICSAIAVGGGGEGGAVVGDLCKYETGEYCAEKLCPNMDQVLKNPNMYLNRTALISMARPLTR